MRFTDVLQQVLDERKNSYVQLSSAVWEGRIANKIITYFEEKNIEDVDDAMLTHFYGMVRRKENGELLSNKYMKAITALMRATMKKAVLKGYIRINPYDYDYRVPKGAVPEPTERLVSDGDIKALMTACRDNERFSVIIPLLLLTGMRIGELLALHWTDIDFDNRLIKVNKSVQIAYRELPTGEIERNGVCIGTPKSASSYRDIPVSNTVIKILVDWLVCTFLQFHNMTFCYLSYPRQPFV